MNILMLSATFPYPPTRGGTSVRTFNLLRYLKEQGHRVSMATLQTKGVSDQDVAELKDWVDELAVFPEPSGPSQSDGKLGQLQRLANFAL
ncbi:MAG: glycosyl transferase family 1, partial [Cyanobacteria bacterium J06555_13]